MNYELAKQLKDAGFSQHRVGAHYSPDGGGYLIYDWAGLSDVDIAIPTLSELIEACGENFSSLIHRAVYWSAKAVLNGNDDGIWVDGSTPEEAVAKLWLALNKKND